MPAPTHPACHIPVQYSLSSLNELEMGLQALQDYLAAGTPCLPSAGNGTRLPTAARTPKQNSG